MNADDKLYQPLIDDIQGVIDSNGKDICGYVILF